MKTARVLIGAFVAGTLLTMLMHLACILIDNDAIRAVVVVVIFFASVAVVGRVVDRLEGVHRGNRRRGQHGWRA